MINLKRAIKQMEANKPLQLIKDSIQLHLQAEDKRSFYTTVREEYDVLYPMYKEVTTTDEDGNEVTVTEVIDYHKYNEDGEEIGYIYGYLAYNEYINETIVLTEATEATYDADGNILTEAVEEVTELVRPYVATTITDTDIEAKLNTLDEYKAYKNRNKVEALKRLTVTTTSGKEFYADAESRVDIADAIGIGTENNLTTTMWKCKSGLVEVTLDELKEARLLALTAKGSIVGI